jgi:hypothetical protein
MNLLLRGILSRLLHLQRLAGWTAGDVCYDQQTPRNPKLMKNVLAFFVTVFIGVAAGSCLFVMDAIEAETKRRSVSASTRH